MQIFLETREKKDWIRVDVVLVTSYNLMQEIFLWATAHTFMAAMFPNQGSVAPSGPNCAVPILPLKWLVHPKITILLLITHPHVVVWIVE